MNDDRQTACQESVEYVHQGDLPLSCPMPHQKLWNAHPRVYLAIEKTGQANCPYCGTQYQLRSQSLL